ncbi:hypothetical protein J437_LFUL014407 [Ladona fulva]|uniref:tRNA (guanine-N(7)-)-methyltransferase non-catalytic subunit n=1 Tax=Ladona fulva TaxID=123851 RepID=A0A8K0P061_LADFU|nr:hypothetical protein J437_LFUL014407 [Ladona fulva]
MLKKEDVVDLINHKRGQYKYGESSKSVGSGNERRDQGGEGMGIPGCSIKDPQPMDSDPIGDPDDEREVQFIISADISRCGQYIAMVSSEKHLLLWNTNNWELMNVRMLPRRPSRVRFTPISVEILVADKAGALYSYPLYDDSSNGKLILAHLSMLLDVIVTPDERFIITCDRDEKIRVSYFAAPYNIQAFCQGHLEFVSSIALLLSNPSILVSGSGDGTIRFWNYYTGTEIEALHCHTIHGDGEDDSDSLAVKSFSMQNINEKAVLCVCLSEFCGSLVYEIETHNMLVDIKFILKLSYAAEPLCLTLDSYSLLWAAVPVNGHVEIQCHGVRRPVSDDVQYLLRRINANKEFLSESLLVPSLVPILFKKKYDNPSSDREGSGETPSSPVRNGPPAKKAKQSCDKQDST